AGEYAALTPSFSRPARSASIAALSPKPLMVTLTPAPASALAMPSPMPEVEPVTTADFPLSMGGCPAAGSAPRQWERGGGGNVALQYSCQMADLRTLIKYRTALGRPFDRAGGAG